MRRLALVLILACALGAPAEERSPGAEREAEARRVAKLVGQGQEAEARTLLEDLMARQPDDYVLKNNAAWLYATSTNGAVRNPARAVSLAREALLLEPGDYRIWSTLADAHYAQGDFEKAARAARQALELAETRKLAPADLAACKDLYAKTRKAAAAFSLAE